MKYAFFLGAGASKSCGAPLQGELFKEYFLVRQEKHRHNHDFDAEHDMEREISTLFAFLFGIDVDNGDLDQIVFPTFEEVLGLLDLAIIRKQTLKNFENAHHNLNSDNRIEKCRQYLTYLMASILYDKLNDVHNNHKDLVKSLDVADKLRDSIFISTNYDILIDNALFEMSFNHPTRYMPDYGFKFADYPQNTNVLSIPLYKLHGSLNWLYCPTCDTMDLTINEKGAIHLIRPEHESEKIQCQQCGSIKESVIVPPTYFKDYNNYFLTQVWHGAEQDLRSVEKIFFCGYSFPDADIHIKYLLKRIETNRNGAPLQVYVANGHRHKLKREKEAEMSRYNRFFTRDVVYLNTGFAGLIKSIDKYL